jgi:hypothetical protein
MVNIRTRHVPARGAQSVDLPRLSDPELIGRVGHGHYTVRCLPEGVELLNRVWYEGVPIGAVVP